MNFVNMPEIYCVMKMFWIFLKMYEAKKLIPIKNRTYTQTSHNIFILGSIFLNKYKEVH